MKESVSFLKPIKSKTLRLTFGFTNPIDKKVNPLKLLQPSITHFEQFTIGRFFWFIVDLREWIHVCGGGAIEQMTPLKSSDFFNGDHQKLHAVTHPEDLPQVMAFSQFWVNYHLSLDKDRRAYSKMTLYFRIKNNLNIYYWVMVQYSDAIFDNDGKFVYGLVFVTDISHLKTEGNPMLTILDTYDGSCQQFYAREFETLSAITLLNKLTTREREVLHFLAIGCSSKQIAAKLNLSIKTIDNHRQNMLHKTNSKSTGELISFSITNGYL